MCNNSSRRIVCIAMRPNNNNNDDDDDDDDVQSYSLGNANVHLTRGSWARPSPSPQTTS